MQTDLAFAQTLFTRPELSAHKPVPLPPSTDQIAKAHAADLSHWKAHSCGRYIIEIDGEPVGFCGLTVRDGIEGLNLSYHLLPEHWGRGHATSLVRGLVVFAERQLPQHGPIYGLVRPANPASVRVLVKAGFACSGELIHGGAPTTRYSRTI